MTKKDYVAIARAIQETREKYTGIHTAVVLDMLVDKLCADTFPLDNPRFDPLRFKAASGSK